MDRALSALHFDLLNDGHLWRGMWYVCYSFKRATDRCMYFEAVTEPVGVVPARGTQQ